MATQTFPIPQQQLHANTPVSMQLSLAGGYTQATVGGTLVCSSWSTYTGTLQLVVDSSTDGGATWGNELDDTWPGGFLDHHGLLPGAAVVYMDGLARTMRATVTASKNVSAGANIFETTSP